MTTRLIDSGPDVIEWRQEVVSEDEYGTPVHVPGSVVETFTAHVQRSSSEDETNLGQQVTDSYVFNTSRPVSGAHSQIVVNGRPCDLIRPPQPQGRSARTRHVRVYFRYLDEES